MEDRGWTPLERALLKGTEEDLIAALDGVDVNATVFRVQTPLLHTTLNQQYRFTEILLLNGADPNRRPYLERDGSTLNEAPIDFTTEFHVLKLLVEAGADVNRIDRTGVPTLVRVCRHFREDSARFLIESGANVNAISTTLQTPLIAAVEMPEIVRLLLEHGANPNNQDSQGNTALHKALHPISTKLLLEFGADPTIRNHRGHLPLHALLPEGSWNRPEATARLLYDHTPGPHEPPIDHPLYKRIASLHTQMALRRLPGTGGEVTHRVLGYLGLPQPPQSQASSKRVRRGPHMV
jgi:ankyrin repeat protein